MNIPDNLTIGSFGPCRKNFPALCERPCSPCKKAAGASATHSCHAILLSKARRFIPAMKTLSNKNSETLFGVGDCLVSDRISGPWLPCATIRVFVCNCPFPFALSRQQAMELMILFRSSGELVTSSASWGDSRRRLRHCSNLVAATSCW